MIRLLQPSSRTGRILVVQDSLIDRSRQATSNLSVLRTKLDLWTESMMSMSRSLQYSLINICKAQPQVYVQTSALQQDSNVESSIWNWFQVIM